MRLRRVEELRSGVPAPEQPRPAPKPRRPPVPAQPSTEHDLPAKESPRVKTGKPKVRKKKHTQQGALRF